MMASMYTYIHTVTNIITTSSFAHYSTILLSFPLAPLLVLGFLPTKHVAKAFEEDIPE